MFVLITITPDVSDNRQYVFSWSLQSVRIPLNPDQRLIYIKDIPKDFYADPHRYYVEFPNREFTEDTKLRKNPHRIM